MAARGRLSASDNAGLIADIRWLAGGWLLACLLIQHCAELPAAWLAWSALLAGALCLTVFRLALVSGLLLGAGYTVLVAQQQLAMRLPAEAHGSERIIQGTVSGLPEVQTTAAGRVLRFGFKPVDDELRRIRVSWYGSQAEVSSGDCWRLNLRLRSPRGSQNPGGLDYEGWLFRQGIDATATVRDARPCNDDARMPLARMRQVIADRLHEVLPDHPMLPFVLGLAVGDRSQMTPEHWQVLRRTGVAHLLAISGLHIGLVAGFVFLLGSRAWRCVPGLVLRLPASHAGAMMAALAGLLYAALAGFSLPTQRALIMLLALLLAVLLRRRLQPSRLLACALLLVLLLDPFAVASAGFWLSFGAVAWIFYVLQSRLRPAEGWRLWLWLQCVLGLALLPLTLFWFGEGSWLAPLANLVMIPLFFLLVPAVLLATLMALAGSGWAILPLRLVADCLHGVWQVLELAAQGAAPVLNQAPLSGLAVAAALLGCLWLFAPRGWPARGLGVLLLLPLLAPGGGENPPPGSLDVAVLDVGQGLSVVLRTTDHVLVYDAGPAWEGGFDAGAMVLVPYLRHAGIGQVDRYVQSHGDLDHGGGAGALRREIRLRHELGSGQGDTCVAGQQWRWDGVDFRVLHPADTRLRGNNASCVLRVAAGPHVLLLTGDIEREAEMQLLRRDADALKVDVLLVPHHGSASSSSIGFLNHTDPQWAIVSAGWRNQWNLPNDRVLRRYAARDIPVLNTARSGAIRFRLDAQHGAGELHAYRWRNRRFWYADQPGCCTKAP